jgi:alpha-ketoglutarate-dependent taurine dioxygenase
VVFGRIALPAQRPAFDSLRAQGDGGALPRTLLHAVRKAQWESSVSFDWAPGDLLVLDNFFAMHGRFSFTPPRELYLAVVGGNVV